MDIEKFIDEPTAKKSTSRTFIGVGVVLSAMLLTLSLVWGYLLDIKLFISIFSFVVLVFSVIMVVLVTTIRAELSENKYIFYLSTTSFMTFISIIMVILFIILTVNVFKNNKGTKTNISVESRPAFNENVFNRSEPEF
jgi:hypothetical protein